MSFLKKLFGGGKADGTNDREAVEYNGFSIQTAPINEGGQYRVCAIISKEVDGETRTHKLIRADVCSSADEASEISMRKAKQMIDEQGDRLPLETAQ